MKSWSPSPPPPPQDETDEPAYVQEQYRRRRQQGLLQNLVHEELRKQVLEVYDFSTAIRLGSGGFGTVQSVERRDCRRRYAIKVVELFRVRTKHQSDRMLHEVEVMKQLDHPNIVRLQQVFQIPGRYLFLCMDLCEGGNLMESYQFESERSAAVLVRKIVHGMRYCHDRSIGHRDLKLENIMFTHKGPGAEVKIVDFGLSATSRDHKLEHDVIGTWIYMAPEVVHGSHFPTACDMWSIGVIAYLLLCGYPPFVADHLEKLKWQIQYGTYCFKEKAWQNISPLAKSFIRRLLVRHPLERMSAAEAQRHPWLSADNPSRQPLKPDVLHNIMRFRNTNTLQKLALEVVARNLESDQIRDLEKEFHKADVDGDGLISLAELRDILLVSFGDSGRLGSKDVEHIFRTINVDRSGKLHFNDFLAASLNRRLMNDQRLHLAFDRLDYDHSGKITVEDLQLTAGKDMDRETLVKTIANFDRDGDGKIDFSEFCEAMRDGNSFDMFELATMTHGSIHDAIHGVPAPSPKAVERLKFPQFEKEDTSAEEEDLPEWSTAVRGMSS